MATEKSVSAKNVFLTVDFRILDWESDNWERYEYTINKCNFIDHLNNTEISDDELRKLVDKAGLMSIEELQETFSEQWGKWCDSASQEEIYKIPMMSALRYYPDFVMFTGDEETSCATCLVFDNELDSWAVGMTGGGMNLAPHLLDTFVNLGKGVPLQLADNISKNYCAYVSKEIHHRNCDLLAKAYKNFSKEMNQRAAELSVIS